LRLQEEKLSSNLVFKKKSDRKGFMEALNFRFDRMSTATTMGQTTKTGEILIFCSSAASFQFIALA
jgi:hypothetical protein